MKKKLLVVLMMLAMCFAMASCGGKDELSGDIKIGTLVGPTGMGLIDLQDNENIDLELYQAPTDAVQKLISGDIDVACVPSNLGPVLYNKTGGQVQILTTVVNGVLYVVENGESAKALTDLKGKTIFASGKGGTPEYVLTALLEDAGLEVGKDVTIKWFDNHADVAQQIATKKGAIGLLPEPQVSAIEAKAKTVKTALDCNALWQDLTGQELPMGILLAKKSFVESRATDIETLLSLVAASVEDVNSASDEVVQKIVDAGIVPSAEICKAVIPNCSIVCMSAEDSKATLAAFFQRLYEVEATAVGGEMPGDDIYYGIK